MNNIANDAVTTALQMRGLKVTEARLLVLDILKSNAIKHLNAEDIFTQLNQDSKSIGIATVYRTLGQLEGVGLIERHSFSDNSAVYELCTNEHHDHMVCDNCGKVIEFVNQQIEDLQHKVAKQADFCLKRHSLILYGMCGDCS